MSSGQTYCWRVTNETRANTDYRCRGSSLSRMDHSDSARLPQSWPLLRLPDHSPAIWFLGRRLGCSPDSNDVDFTSSIIASACLSRAVGSCLDSVPLNTKANAQIRMWPLQQTGAKAFTLVELLMVIAVIAILAVSLLPAISRGKAKAHQIRCVGNLHQLGLGLQNFLMENHAYPSIIGPTNSENPGFWISQLASGGFGTTKPLSNVFNQGVWLCPSAPHYMQPPNNDVEFCSYGYNVYGVRWPSDHTNALGLHGSFVPGATFIKGFPGFAPVRESEVTSPADMMAIGDSIAGALTFDRLDRGFFDRYRTAATVRHQGRINVLFCDGHVASLAIGFVFTNASDVSLVRWNRDHQAHRDLSGTP
jgi:prepilin-type processing-associated H-X9-DG protein/prepilin-type N-terminal cleavage/methylation domain-containing protein